MSAPAPVAASMRPPLTDRQAARVAALLGLVREPDYAEEAT